MGTVVHLTDQSIQLSANNWNEAYASLGGIYASLSQYLPLSGGDVTGGLSVTGNISGFNTTVFFNAGSATGFRSFATNTGQATATNSFAEGNNTRAHGSASHAEGQNTIASGTASHAEGNANVASGTFSHVQGANSEATGLISHAQGSRSRAVGDYTFAGGRRAVAKDDYSYVWATEVSPATTEISSTRVGQYLVSAVGGVFIPGNVGIGTDSIDNALTVAGTISTSNHGDSSNWQEAYNTATVYQNVSSIWQSTYQTVCALSAAWEGSADILPTVTNYLSTNNVLISALTVPGDLSATKLYGDGSGLTNINFVLSSNNVTLSTTTLNPIATLSGTNFITSRVLQDKLGEIISVKDFGARGDGIANDWLPIQRALSAAAGIARVFIPSGLYFISQELRVPSNSYIYGAGIGSTVIKLSSTANASQCVMTNSQNTRTVITNQGNENIVIKDLELDGNVSRFPGSYSPIGDTSGTGLCLANVHNAFIERVSVHDTCRHCIDISAPETSITFNPLDYVPNPSYNVHLKDIVAYGAGDDNISTHFSHSIIIENAYVPYTGGTEVPTNSNGIEIDDGSYDITIIGGYIKNCRRGLEVKGHSWAPAAKRVKVYGLTVENCVRNFGIRHLGFDFTDSKTAFDVALYDCTSIAPVSSTFTADTPRSLQISNYDGVFVKDFKVVGEHNASRAVTIQERARNVKIDGMTFTQISGAVTGITDALLYVDNTTQRNVTLQNLVFRDCVGLPIYITGSIPGIVVDGVDAFTTVSPRASSVVDFTWAPTTVPYTVRNVSVSGYNYAHTLGGSHNFDYTLPSNVGLIENIVPSSPASTNTQYTVAKFGWREGTGQSLNAGIGVKVDFTSNIFSGVSAGLDVPVAYIGTRKVNGTDSDVTSNLIFGTLSANNASMADRMLITPAGNVGINTATPNERLTVRGSISATESILSNQVNANVYLSGGTNLLNILSSSGNTGNNNYTYVTTSQNIFSNNKYAFDTLSGSLTATLPQNPNYGDEIELFDVRGVWSTNSLIVVSDNYIEQRQEPLNCNVRFGLIKLIYTNDNIGWRIIPYPRHNVQPILAPNVSIQTDVLSGFTPLAVNFTGVNNLGEDIAPVSTWIWNLTGGNTPQFTTQNVTYTYQTSGTYVVNLTASNSVGTNTASVTVSATTIAIPTSGLLVRFNADSGVTESGGSITSWTDQQNGVVATAFNGPALLTNEFNSRNAVSFDGTNDYFTFTLPTGLTSSQNRTIFVIGKYTNPTGRSQNGMLNSISPAQDRAYVFHNAFTSDAYFFTGSNQYGPAPFTPNAYMVQSIVQRTNGSGFIRVNGVPSTDTSANTTQNIDSFVIGGRSTSSERFLGTIVELLIYDRELTIEEIEQVETYANIP